MALLAFAPDGVIIRRQLERSWSSGAVTFDDWQGTLSEHEEFPDFEPYTPSGIEVFTDDDGSDWLRPFLRFVDRDVWDDEWTHWQAAEVWPEDIVRLCHRARCLAEGLEAMVELRRLAPKDYFDSVQDNVLETFVTGRMKEDLKAILETVAVWRASPEGQALEKLTHRKKDDEDEQNLG